MLHTGLTDIQGAEFDTFYLWPAGLIAIDTSDPSVVVISSGAISISFGMHCVTSRDCFHGCCLPSAIVWLLFCIVSDINLVRHYYIQRMNC